MSLPDQCVKCSDSDEGDSCSEAQTFGCGNSDPEPGIGAGALAQADCIAVRHFETAFLKHVVYELCGHGVMGAGG